MSYLREQDDHRDPRHDSMRAEDTFANKEHELTLSSAAIFGIFFGQVVLCGIFFGFGYSMGGHRATGPTEATTESTPASGADFSSFKPAAGQPVGSRSSAATQATGAARSAANESVADEPAASAPEVPPARATPSTAPSSRATTLATKAAPATTPSTAAASQGLWVQVAAISVTHPEDAAMLQNALRSKGYSVSQHPGPDSYIHLLLGPFNDRASADAMRQRLATDGYTAYIK